MSNGEKNTDHRYHGPGWFLSSRAVAAKGYDVHGLTRRQARSIPTGSIISLDIPMIPMHGSIPLLSAQLPGSLSFAIMGQKDCATP